MDDQANDLRRLAQQGIPAHTAGGPRPRIVLITSGKGGVGTTTLAIAVAAVAARRGRRIVLVDANPHGGDVALLCRLTEQWTLADLLLDHCTLDEALESGPAGMRVLPGVWGQDALKTYSAGAQQRLLEQLHALGGEADYIVIDAGCGSGHVLRRFWQAADAVVAVTTPQITSVMDTYASIKLLATGDRFDSVLLVVNRAPSGEAAQEVYRRLSRACRGFLELELPFAGHIRHAAALAEQIPDPMALLDGDSCQDLALATDVILATADRNPPLVEEHRPPPALCATA